MKGMDFGNSPVTKKTGNTLPLDAEGNPKAMPSKYEPELTKRMQTPGWNEGTKYSDLSDEDKKRISNPEYQKLLKEKVEAEIKANE